MSEEIEHINISESNSNINKDLSLENEFESIFNDILTIKETINTLTTRMRAFKKKLDKECGVKKDSKELKPAKDKKEKEPKEPKDPKEKKTKEKKPKEQKIGHPSGLIKPVKISDNMAKFINKPIGIEMTRTEVTDILYKYIQDNHLQDENNKRIIKPNQELKEFLKLEDNQELTYFNIQKIINTHFIHTDDDIEVEN
jgi:chromatin remodeling complex protein RSC6